MIKPHENLQELLKVFGIKDFNPDSPAHCDDLNKRSVNLIRQNNGALQEIPPFEKHPYLQPLNPDYHVTGLMLGTFPPISYLCDSLGIGRLTFRDQKIPPSDLPFFHGNYTSFWKYCPIPIAEISRRRRSEQPLLIKNSLEQSQLLYTDIIKYCQRETACNKETKKCTYTAADKLLNNIVINADVYRFLFENESITRICFTNATFFRKTGDLFDQDGNYTIGERDAFQLFLKGAQDLGYKIEYSLPKAPQIWVNINEGRRHSKVRADINKTLHHKVLMSLRLTKTGIRRVFNVCAGVSPAAVNRGKSRKNLCIKRYSEMHNVDIEQGPGELLKTVLRAFFEDNLTELNQYNVY